MTDVFTLGQLSAARDYYDTHGYVRVKGALDVGAIERFLAAYDKIKSNKLFVYYSQSLQAAVRPRVSGDGHIQESMQNASRLGFFPKFGKAMRGLLFQAGVADALSAVTGSREHVSWQNMFFDQSTGTIEHQDSWYLDTEPAGSLIGVWYALEDIHASSGPFFVAPGSHKLGLVNRDDYPDHDDFVAHIRELIAGDDYDLVPMHLERGEILLWHPFLIHGAFKPDNPRHSRKSLTCHFYPRGLTAKDTEKDKLLSIYNHTSPRATDNPRLWEASRFDDRIYNSLVYLLYAKRAVRSGRQIIMRRDSYATSA